MFRGAAFFNVADDHTLGLRQTEVTRNALVDNIYFHAGPEIAFHFSFFLQLSNDALHAVNWSRKTVTDIRLADAGGVNERVNADDLAGAVDKRAATVAGIDYSVGLNQSSVRAIVIDIQVHSFCAHDAYRNNWLIN